MPGISLRCELNKKNTLEQNSIGPDLFLEAVKSIMHNQTYERRILLRDPYQVVCTSYPEYPIKILNDTKFWACLEGKVYGKNDVSLECELSDLIELLFGTNFSTEKHKKMLADWLLETDGDFVLYVLDKRTNNFFVMNDLLGRLPLYYCFKDKAELIISREIQFLSYLFHDSYENDNKFDMMGIAQFLLFSHTLGRRTLLTDISRLEAASILRVSKDNSKIEVYNLHIFDFEDKTYAHDSINKNVQGLVPLFLEACKNRVDQNAKNLISLSGGFDSRAVAASLHRSKILCYAVTSPEPSWRPVIGNLSETLIAEKLADALNIEYENYGIMVPKATNLLTLIRIKNGLTYLGHGFLPCFLEKVKDRHRSSAINFFTGHGGDVSFTNLSCDIPDIDSCIRSILRLKGCFPIDVISRLTRINEIEIINEIRNILARYPEEDPRLKLEHFIFFETNAKFGFEIEDVNRIYFWTVAPFYSVPFFKYIFSCPGKNKEKLTLYRQFLIAISPAIAAIDNSNWGCSILSKRFKIQQYLLHLLFKYPWLRRFVKKIYGKRGYYYKDDSRIIKCMSEQLKMCNEMTNFLSPNTTQEILKHCTQYSHEAIENLFTVTSLIEQKVCKRNTISKYY